jgi:hypothetical protein
MSCTSRTKVGIARTAAGYSHIARRKEAEVGDVTTSGITMKIA